MNEAFLHYIWKYRLFNSALSTASGDEITVISPGIHNHNAGPDFSDARIRIGDTLWVGNVEIHLNTSDWFRHGHQHDPAYDSVILHVVYNHDSGSQQAGIPVAEIRDTFDPAIFSNYQAFMLSKSRIPCIRQIRTLEQEEITLWLERMLIERLEHKSEIIQDFLAVTGNDWESTFYLMLARGFGFKLNALPFEMMARSLSFKLLNKHFTNPVQVEALVLGQSGLLNNTLNDAWPKTLFEEYSFLKKKYDLVPVAPHLWKFMRLRPVNFPTIRLAQFAALFAGQDMLLSRVAGCQDVESLIELFRVTASGYWDTHYHFHKPGRSVKKKLGVDASVSLIINAVLPFLFSYGRALANDELCNRALAFYRRLPGESNRIVRAWDTSGIDVSSAFSTQALIGLKSDYCDNFRCLDCRIGALLLRNSHNFDHGF